ncbi:hypothetical protein [Vibrio marisflavi]|uniref:Uncharacterized protein n=1 Tax=Vibrio marisflavi CECT 7928 TaxID=634439 RepID=A0ABM8ZYF8_9VIBR|nr:hypothetical protein [Vibrio marisflavi]CAH0535971.1 hypothetical protein VMF7928_00077 [Vibrio marisflavi CECT 7928]
MDNLLSTTQTLNRQLANAIGSPSEKSEKGGLVSALKIFFGRAVTWIQNQFEGKEAASSKSSSPSKKIMHAAYQTLKSAHENALNTTRQLKDQFRSVERAQAKLNSTHNQSLAIRVSSGSLFDKLCAKAADAKADPETIKATDLFTEKELKALKKDIESRVGSQSSRLTKVEAAKIAFNLINEQLQKKADAIRLALPSLP